MSSEFCAQALQQGPRYSPIFIGYITSRLVPVTRTVVWPSNVRVQECAVLQLHTQKECVMLNH